MVSEELAALLKYMSDAAEKDGWVCLSIEGDSGGQNWVENLASSRLARLLDTMSKTGRWSDALSRYVAAALPAIAQLIGLPAPHFPSQTVPGKDALSSPTELVIRIGETAMQSKGGLLLLVDEAQDMPVQARKELLAAVHRTTQMDLPVGLVIAGLPGVFDKMVEAKSCAERMFSVHDIEALSEDDTKEALTAPTADTGISFSKEALSIGASFSEG